MPQNPISLSQRDTACCLHQPFKSTVSPTSTVPIVMSTIDTMRTLMVSHLYGQLCVICDPVSVTLTRSNHNETPHPHSECTKFDSPSDLFNHTSAVPAHDDHHIRQTCERLDVQRGVRPAPHAGITQEVLVRLGNTVGL